MSEKVTINDFLEMKEKEEPITILTAYDHPTAKMIDEAGIDSILVGDSVGNVILGYENTLPVTMNEMIHHTKAVTRATERSLVIGDMPFTSYQTSTSDAVKNAGRFIKEGKASAVKVEGGRGVLDKVKAITNAGIPVMGHLGLTPQWIHQFGGYKVQGKTHKAAKEILEDAKKLEEIGVFSLVLESVPRELAKIITRELRIPTIGIGAGPDCDGQVLVLQDILGISGKSPTFVKKYVDLSPKIQEALNDFKEEVKSGEFPTKEHSFEMNEEELESLKKKLSESGD